eukprot:gnl/Spiro4/23933_TR11850_c0_g1_i1.p1 gnl/Spiro4/23933_TR11850_c0_g1~~gnl/Spiro4/23933_TR11850_c0_g1_i1.p1  ORF type:complete len:459 (-),score=33.35 gnl/Spiro4/23933_TR11850_c0_g1_i1:152-1528(-)
MWRLPFASVRLILQRIGSKARDFPKPLRFFFTGSLSLAAAVLGRRAFADQQGTQSPGPARGSLHTWGENQSGQLGLGSFKPASFPTLVEEFASRTDIKFIAAGGTCSALITDNGELYTWGCGREGRLGYSGEAGGGGLQRGKGGGISTQAFPRVVDGLLGKKVKFVSIGQAHMCAILDDGTVWSWGKGGRHLGIGDDFLRSANPPQAVPGLAGVVQVCCGQDHTLALTADGEVYGWGSNCFGQLGLGDKVAGHSVPHPVAALRGRKIVQIACGLENSFALTADGEVLVWGGQNAHKGRGAIVPIWQPQSLAPLREVCFLASGEYHAAALTNDGRLFTWGLGADGQLGRGTPADSVIPQHVTQLDGKGLKHVSCGGAHTAVTTANGETFVFGRGRYGQLGTGDWTNRFLPVSLRILDRLRFHSNMPDEKNRPRVSQIQCGADHTVAILDEVPVTGTPTP